MSESPTHPDAPRAGGETPSEATLAEIRKGVEDARDGRVVDRGSFAAHASETPETRVDNLLRDFQNACEMVVVLGDSNLSETTKLRAVLRNQLRASLLERHRDGERDAICTGAWAVIYRGGILVRDGTDGGELMVYGTEFEARAKMPKDCRLERVDVLSAPPSPERASAILATPPAASPEPTVNSNDR